MTDQRSHLVFSGIAPHPPIMVPEVGRESIAGVRHSIEAMAELTERLIASGAESVVLISPHAPLEIDSFVAYEGPEVYGDFGNFRAPETTVSAPVDEQLLTSITEAAAADGYRVSLLPDSDLDHGTAVPLYFLLRNGWQGRVVALGYSFLSNEDHLHFGACIKRAVEEVGRPVGFIASGDLSHRLAPHAPAGFNPVAHVFDETVVAALRANNPQGIVEIDYNLRKVAGECGYRSMLVAIGAGSDVPSSCEVMNYEAPFGVGYLVAQLINQTGEVKPDEAKHYNLAQLARAAVETFIRSHQVIEPPAGTAELLSVPAPCFVSLKTRDGELRGCIGTIEPARETLAHEIVANAISAAISDPRFEPVGEDELANLRYSVDVLRPAEQAAFEDLDPAVFGVIVEEENSSRRGLLLPDIPGVESAEQQVEIAARKGGIPEGTPVKLWRFKVDRFREGETS
jgi:AmmeMemoRadiSam system protein A/AmmeMemoRadiSam system protein B